MASKHSSVEIRALRQCSVDLVMALSTADPLFPQQLFASNLIGQEIVDYCSCQLEVSQTKKASKIISAMTKTVSADPHLFESLVLVLSESGNTALISVGKKLKKIYESIKEELTKTSCNFQSSEAQSPRPSLLSSEAQPLSTHNVHSLQAAHTYVQPLAQQSPSHTLKSIPRPSLEQCFINAGVQVDSEFLDQKIDNPKHIADIAKKFTEWKDLAPYFYIQEEEEEEIKALGNISEQRRKLLIMWIRKSGPNATYRRLCTILWNQERLDIVDNVCKVLKCSISESSANDSCDENRSFLVDDHMKYQLLGKHKLTSVEEECDPPIKKQQQLAVHQSELQQTLSQTPVLNCYAGYLRAMYTQSDFPVYSKWPPSPSKKYINLVIISKDSVTKEDTIRAVQHGKIKEIFKKRVPIKIEEILRTQPEEKIKCILVEGAPGVGKSTFAWTICNKWGKGELYTNYSIVLLLQLRDEEVQKATCIADLIFHNDRKLQEQAAQEISNCHGKGILILLEGLDELPSHLLSNPSIFTHLLLGKVLPQATILVTSRPSDTEKILKDWKHQISRHIQIIGFTEENINDYIQSVIPADEVPNFDRYLSMHPHIKLMLYVPLYCAISTIVYLQCQKSSLPPPKTITGLYTCLTQTILIRYLQHHSDYKELEHNLENFVNLPSPVFNHFRRLCKMAYDNVEKQQLIIYDVPKPFEHLGFMDAVPELFLHRNSAKYSYNFLHLSVQEYLAAYHVSLMSYHEQEQLLRTVRFYDHRFNMTRFLAGITQLKHLNKELVKDMIGISNYNWNRKIFEEEMEDTLYMHGYTLEILYECQDVSILESDYFYHVSIQSTDSAHCLTALGYSIAMSSSKWYISFSGRHNSGAEVMCHNLRENLHPTYSIECIEFCSCDSDFIHQVLNHLPEYTQKHVKAISTDHDDAQPLPQCLSEIIPKMEILTTLKLINVLQSSLTALMPTLSRVPALRNLVIIIII